jgi:hypothetical protein
VNAATLTPEQKCLCCQILAVVAEGKWSTEQASIAAFACGVRVGVTEHGVPFMCSKHRERVLTAISETGVEIVRPS